MLPKRLLTIILTTVLAVMGARAARAQWVQTNGPGIPSVTSFAVIGSNIFAGTSGSGVFRSSNMGMSWTPINDGPSGNNLSHAFGLAAIDSDLFAITSIINGPSTVWRSSDYGKNWSDEASLSGTTAYDVLAGYDNVLFAGTSYQGVWYTTDFGSSWSELPYWQWGAQVITGLSIHGNNILLGNNHNLSMFLSTDRGNSWNSTNVGQQISIFTFIDSEIWVGSRNGRIVYSTDYGAHWLTTSVQLNGAVTSIVGMGDNLFAATSSEIMRTSDGGNSWDSSGTFTSLTALAADGTSLFAATSNGVLRSTDSGSSWQNANSGIVGSGCNGIAVSDSNIISAVGEGFYSSTDNGSTWSFGTLSSMFGVGIETIGAHLFIFDDGNLYERNSITGTGWRVAYSCGSTESISGLAAAGNVLFAETETEVAPYEYVTAVIRSTDYGHTWSSVNTITSLSGIAISDTVLFVNRSGIIYRSTDYGANWSIVSNNVPSSSTLHAIGVVQGTIFVSTGKGVYRSTDSGITWTAEDNGLKDSSLTFLSQNGKLFAQSSSNIYYWLDFRSEWLPIDDGLPTSFTWGHIAANNTYLFVGTDGLGVWKRPLADFGSSLNSSSSISSLSVYPNPLAGQAKISFTALQPGNATIKIFDLIGRMVSSVFQGTLEPGTHSFDWINPKGLTDGAYECEVTLNGQSAYSLLIIVR